MLSHETVTDNGYGFVRPDRLAASCSLWSVFPLMHICQGALLGVIHNLSDTQSADELPTIAALSWLAMTALNAVTEWRALETRKMAVGPWGPVGAEILHGHTGFAATVSSVHRSLEILVANPISMASLIYGGDKSLFLSIIAANVAFSSTALVHLAISTGKADWLLRISQRVVGGLEKVLANDGCLNNIPIWPDMTAEQQELVAHRRAVNAVRAECWASSNRII